MRIARAKLAARTAGFTESVIREMTRLNAIHGGINLAQGFPNFAAPQALKDAAKRAIDADINQYAITWGAKSLRDALSRTYAELYGMRVDPETMLTVTCGATEAMISTLLALVDPGDEVIVLEPSTRTTDPMPTSLARDPSTSRCARRRTSSIATSCARRSARGRRRSS